MAWFRRIFLFLIVNVLVMATISILLAVFNVGPTMSSAGIEYGNLMAFCLIWGMGGAFISLGLSRIMAKFAMGVEVIDPNTPDPSMQRLVQMVHRLARSANLPAMPEVGVYNSPEVNAFATGPTKSRALVAVSTGLLNRMSYEEVEGVVGHEVAHIANGDMVTMTLLQGVVNAFVMFLSRVIAFALSQRSSDDGERRVTHVSPFLVMAIEMVLMLFGSMVVAWFSRWREFRADAGGAKIAGRENMVRALQRLKANVEGVDMDSAPSFMSMKISTKPNRFLALFSSHPPLEQRIERLQQTYSL
jgi:heat shock protein HtpX